MVFLGYSEHENETKRAYFAFGHAVLEREERPTHPPLWRVARFSPVDAELARGFEQQARALLPVAQNEDTDG